MKEIVCKLPKDITDDDPAQCVEVWPFTEEIQEIHAQFAQMRDRGELDPTDPIVIKARSPAPMTAAWVDLANQLGWQRRSDYTPIFHIFTLAAWYENDKDKELAKYYREMVLVRPYERFVEPREALIRVRVFYHGKKVLHSGGPVIRVFVFGPRDNLIRVFNSRRDPPGVIVLRS
jgi:hypothetical protein